MYRKKSAFAPQPAGGETRRTPLGFAHMEGFAEFNTNSRIGASAPSPGPKNTTPEGKSGTVNLLYLRRQALMGPGLAAAPRPGNW
jgi:hypothetical protein